LFLSERSDKIELGALFWGFPKSEHTENELDAGDQDFEGEAPWLGFFRLTHKRTQVRFLDMVVFVRLTHHRKQIEYRGWDVWVDA
jgi:hypothetical protein